ASSAALRMTKARPAASLTASKHKPFITLAASSHGSGVGVGGLAVGDVASVAAGVAAGLRGIAVVGRTSGRLKGVVQAAVSRQNAAKIMHLTSFIHSSLMPTCGIMLITFVRIVGVQVCPYACFDHL